MCAWRFRHAVTRSIPATGLLRWKALDQIAGNRRRGPGFHVAPETFFAERAVPIGFDENPDLLYFAANIGRDTFGVYGLNLKNGQPTRFAFEILERIWSSRRPGDLS